MSADTWIEKQWVETDPRPRGELLAELKSLRAELTKAREALEPFAKYAEGERDTLIISTHHKHFRRARAALTPAKTEGE